MHTVRSSSIVALVLVATLAGCAGAAAPTTTPPSGSPISPPPTEIPVTPVPTDEAPDTGVIGGGGGGGGDPKPGQPQFVVPRPGETVNPRPVSVEMLEARVDGRSVAVVATWWSGVEPCYQLDSVIVNRVDFDITIEITEGSGPGDLACIEIAVLKATVVNLGELEPGEYTVTAPGGTAPPITFTVD